MKENIIDAELQQIAPLIVKGKRQFSQAGVIAGFLVTVISSFFRLTTLFAVSLGKSTFLSLVPCLFFLAIGLFLFATRAQFTVDLRSKLYSQSIIYLGFAKHHWRHLPEIEGVTVAPATLHYSIRDAIRPEMNFEEKKFRVMLYVKDAQRGIIVSYYDKAKAVEIANKVGGYLNVPVEFEE